MEFNLVIRKNELDLTVCQNVNKSQQDNNEFKKSKLQNAKVGILSLIKLKNIQINTVCVCACMCVMTKNIKMWNGKIYSNSKWFTSGRRGRK